MLIAELLFEFRNSVSELFGALIDMSDDVSPYDRLRKSLSVPLIRLGKFIEQCALIDVVVSDLRMDVYIVVCKRIKGRIAVVK